MSPHEQGYRAYATQGRSARCPYEAGAATARERVHWLAGYEKAKREHEGPARSEERRAGE